MMPPDFSMKDWLQSVGLEQYIAAFEQNSVTWNDLPKLTDSDLKDIGVAAWSHRKQLLEEIQNLLTRQSAPESARRPTRLGHFDLLEQIGQGGIGTVFRAWDSSLSRQVALKVLDRELVAEDPQFVEDFIREAKSAAGINHPHIVQIYFAGEDQGEHFIAMELLDGQSMADRLERGPMDEKAVIRAARQVVEGLAATNARRLIHGDIKPHNIFITASGEIKLLDFGLARKTTARVTEQDSFIGSAAYVSPERVQLAAEDFRSDIYSLGATLFEAVSGLPPFDADTPAALAVKRLHEEAPSLRSLRPAVSPSLDRLVARMLARQREERHASYAELSAEIEAAERASFSEFEPGVKASFLPLGAAPAQGAASASVAHQPPATLAAIAPPPATLWKRVSSSRFFLISIAIHVLIGLIATVLVVQSITTKRKLTFKGGPPSPNPSQRATEHKIQMVKKQKTMSAPVPSKRIVTTGLAKVALPPMPEMPSLNATNDAMKMSGLGGFGSGLGAVGGTSSGGGAGGGGLALFGLRGGRGLAGTFYDLKQGRDLKPSEMAVKPGELDGWPGRDEPTNKAYLKVLGNFLQNGMSDSVLSKYFRGTEPLITTQIFIPNIPANDGPKAFSLEGKVQPRRWIVVYRGKVTAPESGTYRFVGYGDDILVVRFDGRVVMDGSLFPPTKNGSKKGASGRPTGNNIEVRAGIAYNMEIIIGECPGGLFSACLQLEKEGAQYPGAPNLPVFKMARSDPPKGGPGAPPFAPDTSWSVWKAQPPPPGASL